MTLNERNVLVENYMPLANKLAYSKAKSTPSNVQVDELKSAAYMGLLDASRKFDPERSVSFGAYASLRIVGEMKDYLREISWGKRGNYVTPVSIDSPLGNENFTFSNLLEDRGLADSTEFFEDVTNGLNRLETHVIILYYIENKTLREIGNSVNLGKSRISQILKKCLASLREKFTGK